MALPPCLYVLLPTPGRAFLRRGLGALWHKKTLKLLISDLAALAQKALSTEINTS